MQDRVHSGLTPSIPDMNKSGSASQLLAMGFSRRANSASTASRMNCARPYLPTTASIRARASGDRRTGVALLPSGGRPMRAAVVDTDKSGKDIENDTVYVDEVNDVVYIDDTVYGDKPMPALTKAQKSRLVEMSRPGHLASVTGNPSRTDLVLGDLGFVIIHEIDGRPGFYRVRITDEGRAAVSPDDFEHCASCHCLTHVKESACIHCAEMKEWAA